MKVCSRCNVEKDDLAFRKKICKRCKQGVYTGNICRGCENERARELDRIKRKANPEYSQRRLSSVKKYQKTEKGKRSKKINDVKYRERHREDYLNRNREYYKSRREHFKKLIDEVSDEYVITSLQSPRRRKTYTREEVLANPDLIEITRIRILQNRLNKTIRKLGKGVCRRCKNTYPKSEFRTRRRRDGDSKKWIQYTDWICKKCLKKENALVWKRTKSLKNLIEK